MYPVSQTLELRQNQELKGIVTVANSGIVPFNFTVKAVPYQVKDDSYNADFSTYNNYTALASWISFEQEAYYLEPGTSVEIPFTVKVPNDAVGGGQYAAIMAYTEDGTDPSAAIKVASQLASIIYGRVIGAEIQPDGEVVEQNIPSFLINGKIESAAKAYNTGNVDFTLSHSITITDFFGNKELVNPNLRDEQGNLLAQQNLVVMPGTSRESKIVWEDTPMLGVFKVKQKVTLLDETLEIEKTVVLCPLWLILAVVALIALLILWILLAIRHHKKKAPQVF